MAGDGGAGGMLETIFGTLGSTKAAENNKKAAQRNRQQQMDFVKSMDFTPAYASDYAPTYQRTQSPVARSYLESFLMGNNPDATFSGAPNSKDTKRLQQASQDHMFGSPQSRVQLQQKLLAEQPWAITSRPGTDELTGGDGLMGTSPQKIFEQQYPVASKLGFSQAMIDDMHKRGIDIESYLDGGERSGDSHLRFGKGTSVAQAVMNAYNAGDYHAAKDLLKQDQPGIVPFGKKTKNARKDRKGDEALYKKYGG